MRALTFQGPGEVRYENVPDPGIEAPGDAVVELRLSKEFSDSPEEGATRAGQALLEVFSSLKQRLSLCLQVPYPPEKTNIHYTRWTGALQQIRT